MNKVLILTDGKAGHENQSRAFARALGCEPVLLPVQFKSPFAKALSYLLDLFGILTTKVFKEFKVLNVLNDLNDLNHPNHPNHLKDPKDLNNQTSQPPNHQPPNHQTTKPPNHYRAVLGTGSGTFYAAKTIAHRLGVPCGVVLYPRGYRLAGFDCILAPSFDRPDSVPNVIPIPANLVANDDAFYEAGVKAFRERYTPSDRPAVAVIVGGPNKCATLSADWMRSQLEQIFAKYKPTNPTPDTKHPTPDTKHQAPSTKHEIWVTTSRRTPPDVEAVVDSFPFDYKLLYSKDHFNPIPAFVSLARVLYVTAESTGMLSEACTFGTAEVHALDNLKSGPHKFRRFIDDLTSAGHLDGARKIDLSEQFARARQLLKINLRDRASERTRDEQGSENH
jgi:hypothetical protein